MVEEGDADRSSPSHTSWPALLRLLLEMAAASCAWVALFHDSVNCSTIRAGSMFWELDCRLMPNKLRLMDKEDEELFRVVELIDAAAVGAFDVVFPKAAYGWNAECCTPALLLSMLEDDLLF
jgi:hypothetical protein